MKTQNIQRLKNVTLEVSLKPFFQTDDESIRQTAKEIYRQWGPLTKHADQISIMFWAADGSEILDYAGKLEDSFDWSRYVGHANKPFADADKDSREVHLHHFKYLYRDNPPVMTYGILKRITQILKEVGKELTGKPIRVGATFDPGPEFAESKFKYERHPEICMGQTMGKKSFVTCYATLHADQHAYAGFPQGIEEGTLFGKFLGRQAEIFIRDLDFDYLWLSNGFGFGLETWSTIGALFDGKTFFPEKMEDTREKILRFWDSFRAEFHYPVETRGTNFSTGIDLASDASPLKTIYEKYDVLPPPNSPWAALDGDFGLELVGYLSRIAKRPGRDFLFRYYIHDPWWVNSPWLDRYEQAAHDIYLPLACSVIDEHGTTLGPTHLNILTVDDTYGNMPEECPNETIPHLLAALDCASDAPSPFVWVYPFDEFHDMTFGKDRRLAEPFFNDWYIRGAINSGFPLSSVVATDVLLKAQEKNSHLFMGSVLVSPIPDAGSEYETGILNALAKGQSVLFYGPVAHASPKLLSVLGLSLTEGISGELKLELNDISLDRFPEHSHLNFPSKIIHRPEFCAGTIDTILDSTTDVKVLATVNNSKAERIYAVQKILSSGNSVVWVRGTVASFHTPGIHLLEPDDPAVIFPAETILRYALGTMGYKIGVYKHSLSYKLHQTSKTGSTKSPVTTVSRNKNAFYFSGYLPNTNSSLRFSFPWGAPLFVGQEAILSQSETHYYLTRSWHYVCRVFVDQTTDSEVSCTERCAHSPGFTRRFFVTGLEKANLRFYPEVGLEANTIFHHNIQEIYHVCKGTPEEIQGMLKKDASGQFFEFKNITGTLLISW